MQIRRLNIVLLIITVLGIIGCILLTIPLYPDFQRPVATYESLREELSGAPEIIFPDISGPNVSTLSYSLQLSSRTVFHRAVGYVISGSIEGSSETYSYTISCTPETVQEAYQNHIAYRGIPIAINKQSWGTCVSVQLNGYTYVCNIIRTEDEPDDQQRDLVMEGHALHFSKSLIDFYFKQINKNY